MEASKIHLQIEDEVDDLITLRIEYLNTFPIHVLIHEEKNSNELFHLIKSKAPYLTDYDLIRRISDDVFNFIYSGQTGINAFNSKWRVYCFREHIKKFIEFTDVTHEEATQAINECLVIDSVLTE